MQLKMMATSMIPAYLSYQSEPCRTDGRKSKEQEQMKTLPTHLNTHTPDLFCLSRRGLGSLQSRLTAGHRYQPPPLLSKTNGHWFSPQETRRDILPNEYRSSGMTREFLPLFPQVSSLKKHTPIVNLAYPFFGRNCDAGMACGGYGDFLCTKPFFRKTIFSPPLEIIRSLLT